MRLEHVNLTVTDIDRSVDFYSRLLGLEIRWRGHTTSGRPAVHLGADTWYLSLFEGDPAALPVAYEQVGYNHLGIVVTDLDATKARLEGLGTEVAFEPEYEPGRRAYFFDPDGYEVELVEYPSAA